MDKKPQCCERVFHQGAFRSVQCTRAATKEHEGKPYCSQHHPPTVNARREERNQRWRDEWAAQQAASEKAERERREMKHRAACFPELLDALRSFVAEFGDKAVSANVRKARAAIAKATGEQP